MTKAKKGNSPKGARMSHFVVYVFGENPEEQLAPFNEDCQTLDKTNMKFQEERGGCDIHEDKLGYWSNPNAQWDWYELGGRWSNRFTLKDEGSLSKHGGRIVYWSGHKEKNEKETKTDQAKLKDIWINDIGYPWAFLHDGKWYEKGSMGWFGTSSHDEELGEEKQELQYRAKFIEVLLSLPEETLISNYDLHI